ncbi:hypothetical protein [Mucilaginibacter sp.]
MTPQPFTPAGFQSLITELGQLSQSELQTQANLIRSDLRSWASTNFTLTQDQSTYLAAIDDGFFDYAGPVTAVAVIHKLPITLSVPNKNPTTFKLIHSSDTIVTTYSPDGLTVTGGVAYSIDYQ